MDFASFGEGSVIQSVREDLSPGSLGQQSLMGAAQELEKACAVWQGRAAGSRNCGCMSSSCWEGHNGKVGSSGAFLELASSPINGGPKTVSGSLLSLTFLQCLWALDGRRKGPESLPAPASCSSEGVGQGPRAPAPIFHENISGRYIC